MDVDGFTLTAAEQVALIEGPVLYVDAGLELLDSFDTVLDDISADFVPAASEVDRGMYRTVHGRARLVVSRELQWGSQRLRPYLRLSADRVTYNRFDLGVFLMSTPERRVGGNPPLWEVDCFDKLDILNVPIQTVSVPAGANVVDAVIELIEDTGETAVSIEPSDKVTPEVRVFSVVDDWTRLTVCNNLLNSIGYRALHANRAGTYRSTPYVAPTDLAPMWSYDATSPTTTVAEDRSSTADLYRAANVIYGVNDNVTGDLPTPGNGLFTLENPADGPTSIAERGGRRIPRTVRGSFADQDALETAVRQALDSEKRVANHVEMATSPNPLHYHFDVVNLRDDDIPVNGRFLLTDWKLPLDGSDMQLSLRGV